MCTWHVRRRHSTRPYAIATRVTSALCYHTTWVVPILSWCCNRAGLPNIALLFSLSPPFSLIHIRVNLSTHLKRWDLSTMYRSSSYLLVRHHHPKNSLKKKNTKFFVYTQSWHVSLSLSLSLSPFTLDQLCVVTVFFFRLVFFY